MFDKRKGPTKKKRTFSVLERWRYHFNRAAELKSASESQKRYSMAWLEGFNDNNVDKNLPATVHEKKRYKDDGLLVKDNAVLYDGYIAGAKAQLEQRAELDRKHKK